MICKFCGNEIDDGSDFCFICGQKVEAPVAEANVNSDNVYSQPAGPAPAAPAAQPQQPAAQYQAPAVPVAPAAPVAEGKKKKQKAPKDPSVATKAQKFFSFLFVLVGIILYVKATKAGYEKKAASILNSMMIGLCVKMAILNVVLAKKYLFA